MRRMDWLVGAMALVAGGAGAVSFGACSTDLADCSKYPAAGCPGYGSGGGTTTMSSGTMSSPSSTNGTGASASTGTGGMAADCGLDPLTNPEAVSDACGVFVSTSGASTNAGTQESPLGAISDALVKAQTGSKPYVFVCAEAYTETTTLSINHAIKIYGNLMGCQPITADGGTGDGGAADGGAGWTMGEATSEGERATLNGPTDAITMLVAPASGTVDIYGLNVASPAAAKMADGNGVRRLVDRGVRQRRDGELHQW